MNTVLGARPLVNKYLWNDLLFPGVPFYLKEKQNKDTKTPEEFMAILLRTHLMASPKKPNATPSAHSFLASDFPSGTGSTGLCFGL